ncbi:MAG: sel1 repeat family protein [Polyangiaceae bacterium]|nr:sel1 repeat family protein [Polyangiaceae bacterium]
MPRGNVVRLIGGVVLLALAGCAPGANADPQTTAAKAGGDGDNHGGPTPAPSPPKNAEAAVVSWESVDPNGADAKTLARAGAECKRRSEASKAGSQELLACVWLGSAKLANGDQRDALEHFRAACEAGEALGCVGEGNVLMEGGVAVTGKGVLREPEAAETAWKRACELGARSGCWLLAQTLERGKKSDAAREYREKSCDLGVVEACGEPSK